MINFLSNCFLKETGGVAPTEFFVQFYLLNLQYDKFWPQTKHAQNSRPDERFTTHVTYKVHRVSMAGSVVPPGDETEWRRILDYIGRLYELEHLGPT
jgi:hypothetical protein